MKKPIIHNLFSIPIYNTELERDLTKEEINFAINEKKHCKNNTGNTHTKDCYILNRPELRNIKIFLEEHCKNYLNTIICPSDKIELYITQSWLNYTETNQYHHKHEHPNSVISGTFYFDADEDTDQIMFASPRGYQLMSPTVNKKNFNHWNSETWWFPVKTGELYMFPSSTTHQVVTKKGNNTRISLAFNTFYKGRIGSYNNLTELIL
tara:strand:- start:20 stop:643 length:624 start_codon:yes stop_codon:yes gene_type:complete